MAPVMEINIHKDFVSDMTDDAGHKTLIAVR